MSKLRIGTLRYWTDRLAFDYVDPGSENYNPTLANQNCEIFNGSEWVPDEKLNGYLILQEMLSKPKAC